MYSKILLTSKALIGEIHIVLGKAHLVLLALPSKRQVVFFFNRRITINGRVDIGS